MTFLSSDVVFRSGMGIYPRGAALAGESHRCLPSAVCEEITLSRTSPRVQPAHRVDHAVENCRSGTDRCGA